MTQVLNVDWRTIPNAPATGTELCALHELADGATQEFCFTTDAHTAPPFRMLLHRRGNEVYGYVNQCPHQWLPMNRSDGKFLMWSDHELMCTHHSAVFKLTDRGTCIMGPCQGSNLIGVPTMVAAGRVLVGS